MSGHSQFKNIMYRKGAQDAKKARVFAKLAREITVAAKSGLPEPDKNPRLRLAIQAARAESMPKDNIERAIAKATQVAGGADFTTMRYEGFSPNKVAVIVEALTDNKNRTASNVRSIFGKRGGAMGETGSVSFNFERIGYNSSMRWKKTKTFSTFTTMQKFLTILWLSWRPNNAYPRSGSEHFLYRLGNY